MKNSIFKYLTLGILAMLISVTALTQSVYELNQEKSKILLSGTSNLHDWEMEARTFNCETTIEFQDGKLAGIDAINFTAKVDNIESGKRIMDSKAHDALKEKQHPKISFKLNSNDPVKISGNHAKLAGTLNIAGKNRVVEFSCNFIEEGNNHFIVKGEVPLKMTDFDVEPPTAMLGALETGDEIKVKFDFKFNKSPEKLSGISNHN